MQDKFLVKNNSGTILKLIKNRITIAVDGQIDLATRLNKTIAELKRDPEISREITYNNLVILEEFDASKDYELRDKLDVLIDIMSKEKKDKPQVNISDGIIDAIEKILNEKLSKINVNTIQNDANHEIVDREEDRLREKVLEQLVSRQKPTEMNFESLGSEKKIEKKEDFSDLIDF
jgi:hypothetical protein